MPQISLYAELLLHIRTVSLIATLQTLSNKETKASLSADGETISLTHEGETASIRLPTTISGGGDAALMLPAAPAKELTLRLQLEEKAPGLLRLGGGGRENHVPWSASELNGQDVRVLCASGGCGEELVKRRVIGEEGWKDLPSENWAEMMDFWHCHKPDHLHGGAGDGKGYAAANRLVARSGTAFVDLTHFLLKEEDCCGIQVGHTFLGSIPPHPL